MLKRTPLYAAHQKLGARLIEFGGWEMPVQYSGIVDEHLAVRNAAGIFDISHMGEVIVDGPGAAAFLNAVLTNDIGKLQTGDGQYTLMCNERGGVVDDLYVYRVEPEKFLLIINAGRIEADAGWLEARAQEAPNRSTFQLKNASDEFAAVAVQGPNAAKFIDQCFPAAPGSLLPASMQKNRLINATFSGQSILVSRTGYTGEDGFEIVAPAAVIEEIWRVVLEKGRPFGLKPAGLGARDTLRTEVCYPLYGHELDENSTPIEAGLGYFVALNKGEFTGRSVMAAQKEKGPAKKLVAFKMTNKGGAPPRAGYEIRAAGAEERPIGNVTSGLPSPTLAIGIGLGYVPSAFSAVGTPIDIQIRSVRAPALVVPKPFYKRR
jgi:aminomethyltransferase